MMISIASGKGGTGKTTIATNLAVALDERAQLLDCDVEEPNAHLFINPSFGASQTVSMPVPEVDEDLCTLCGECGAICQFKAIVTIADTVMTFHELCHGCGGCMAVCPAGAIREQHREVGVVEQGVKKGLAFVQGRIRIGEAMAPPLIENVRSCVDPEKIAIIDAPPGTSCPVIAAMKDVDFALLVTEPTPFGLNDLELAVEVVKKLGMPTGLVINRSDIGDSAVADYARREGIPILMEIPFDRKIAEAYSRGDLLVDAFPEWREKFTALYENIYQIVSGKQQS